MAINNLNQTLLNEDQNKNQLKDTRKIKGEKYDLLIQTLEQEYLETLCKQNKLQELRQELYLKRNFKLNYKDINTFLEAFESLLNDIILKEKVYCLLQELLLGYLKVFPHGDFIKTLDKKNYFDIEINKLDDIEDKQNLQYLKKKFISGHIDHIHNKLEQNNQEIIILKEEILRLKQLIRQQSNFKFILF
ncbi:9939_t:CDS:2, partial [Dentiscutata erythropus]